MTRQDHSHVTCDDWFDTYLIYLMWCSYWWSKYRRMHNL